MRWGSHSCPSTAVLIYKGQMVASDRQSVGGGANYLCLPENPEYPDSQGLTASYSDLIHTYYAYDKGKLNHHMVPCVVCEAQNRVSKLMIPA